MKDEDEQSICLDTFLLKEFPDTIFVIEKDIIVDCNEASIKMFGYESKKEVIGLKPFELSPAMQFDGIYSCEKYKDVIMTALINGEHRFEWIHHRKNGEEFFAEVVLVKTYMEGKQIITTLIKDINEQKKMQKLIEESENMYRSLFEKNHTNILLIDPETGNIIDANSAACFYYGYTKDELISLKITDINISTKEKTFQEMENAKLQKRKSFNFKHRLSNGEIRDVEVYSGPIKINNKEILYSMIHDITEKNRLKEESRLNKSYFQQLFRNSPEAITILDNKSNITDINKSFEKLFQYSIEEIRNHNIIDILCPGEVFNEAIEYTSEIEKGGFVRRETIRKCKDGKLIDVAILAYPILNNEEKIGTYVIYTDITERKQNENKLKLFSKVFENNTEGVIISNKNGIIEWVNQATSQITGYAKDELIGATSKIFKSDKKDIDFYKNINQSILEKGTWKGELWIKRKNGKKFIGQFNVFSIDDIEGNTTHFVAIFYDITENKKKEEEIHNLAFRDSLTGLYNRAFFIDKLNNEIVKAQRKKEKLAILYMDLDDLKKINDNLGHFIGDKLLRMVAKRLKQCIRECDIVARIGGDEFIILLSEMNHVENAVSITKKIVDTFKKPFKVDNNELYICISIGIAVYPDNGLDSNTLMANADIAMYEAKKIKGDTIEIFTPILNEKIKEEFMLENSLRHALDRNEFLIYYQPIIDIDTGQIVGTEALLRWKNPRLGFLPPDKFIPIAENNNYILRIGEWVLRIACEQNKKWQDTGHTPIFVSVNISVKQLQQKNFINQLEKILEETGLDAKYLELEITESISVENINAITTILREINNLGVKLSIDDFGTGYSSLGQLKKLAVNKLKIDKSFINDINENMDNTAIVSAIIAMAKTLNIDVVAEGIETTKQLKFLKEKKCDMGQGYLFSRPVDSDSFEKSLLQNFS